MNKISIKPQKLKKKKELLVTIDQKDKRWTIGEKYENYRSNPECLTYNKGGFQEEKTMGGMILFRNLNIHTRKFPGTE